MAETAVEALEAALTNDGNIGVGDFLHLYQFGEYVVKNEKGDVKLEDLLRCARQILIDIKLPTQDVENLLIMAKRRLT